MCLGGSRQLLDLRSGHEGFQLQLSRFRLPPMPPRSSCVMGSILLMCKMRPREVKSLADDNTVRKREGKDLNSDVPVPEPRYEQDLFRPRSGGHPEGCRHCFSASLRSRRTENQAVDVTDHRDSLSEAAGRLPGMDTSQSPRSCRDWAQDGEERPVVDGHSPEKQR